MASPHRNKDDWAVVRHGRQTVCWRKREELAWDEKLHCEPREFLQRRAVQDSKGQGERAGTAQQYNFRLRVAAGENRIYKQSLHYTRVQIPKWLHMKDRH